MTMQISSWVSLLVSASAGSYRTPVLFAAVAVLSYAFGYLCSQMQFAERPSADNEPPRKQSPKDLG